MLSEVLDVLEKNKDRQINLGSKAARESLAVAIVEELDYALDWSYKKDYIRETMGENPYKSSMIKKCSTVFFNMFRKKR